MDDVLGDSEGSGRTKIVQGIFELIRSDIASRSVRNCAIVHPTRDHIDFGLREGSILRHRTIARERLNLTCVILYILENSKIRELTSVMTSGNRAICADDRRN